MQHQLEQLLRWRYGQKSERIDENQLFFEALGAIQAQTPLPAATEPPPDIPERPTPRPGHGRKPLPKNLPRRRVVFDLAADQQHCPHCTGNLRHIGEEVSERLEFIPASLTVIEEACQKYACPQGCTVVTAGKPMAPIEKGLPGPGLLAQVAVSKYADHLPLARQEGMFRRQGVELARSTMCDWMRCCAELTVPLYQVMKQQVLCSKAVQTDDTPVAVFDPEGPRTRTGRIWTYVGDQEHPYIVYDYTPTRGHEGPAAFLEDYNGYLQADAYSGYEPIFADEKHDLIEVACWAHARRKFFVAQSSDLMRSMVMLAYVRLLYDVEREAIARELKGEARRLLRQEKSVPLLDGIERYLLAEQPKVLPKSPIGDTIGYALGNWTALKRYTEDGDLEIDNNGAERSLRGIAVGRKNWLWYGSDRGGQTAAILTSFAATCKRLHIDPFAYLRDIFERISAHPANRLAELLPDRWKAGRSADTSRTQELTLCAGGVFPHMCSPNTYVKCQGNPQPVVNLLHERLFQLFNALTKELLVQRHDLRNIDDRVFR
jgi:transposase